MSEVTDEIDSAISLLKLGSAVKRVTTGLEEALFNELLATFVDGADRRWWWESFKLPSESVVYEDGKGFAKLGKFVPNAEEIVWFVVEDDQLPYYPIFEASTKSIISIVGECFGFEYYLISKDKSWLVCENHHNQIIGVGSKVTATITQANN